MKLLLGGVLAAFAAISACAAPASAGPTLVYTLDQDGCSGGCGLTNYGTVTLTQVATNSVQVDEVLASNVVFVGTGAGQALEFNITASLAPITISGISSPFTLGPSPATASTFGTFAYSINCPKPTYCKGGSKTEPGPLLFSTSDGSVLSTTDFIANVGGYFFASDIGVTNAQGTVIATGNVASKTGSGGGSNTGGNPGGGPVPEPASIVLLGTALAGLGWHRRRRA